MLGAVLSTVIIAEGPAEGATFPLPSLAVPAAKLIPTVPSPKHKDRVTVRVVFPDPLTLTEQFAVPVVFRITSELLSVTAFAPP